MVQGFLPALHELSIMLLCECGHQFIARRAKAGVSVSDIGYAPRAFFTKLNNQPTCCYVGRNLQHFDEPILRLVTCDIPNCGCLLVRRNKDAVTLHHAAGTDYKVTPPSVRPFCFSHGAKEREDLLWRGT